MNSRSLIKPSLILLPGKQPSQGGVMQASWSIMAQRP